MKKILAVFIIILILLAGSLCAAAGIIKNLGKPVSAVDDGTKVRIEIPNGMSVSGAASLLAENSLIRNEKLFYYTARYPQLKAFLYGKDSVSGFVLRSGIYYVSPSMNIAQIQELLSSGQQEYIKVSLPEGLTISKIAAELEENRICAAADFIKVCKDSNFAALNGITGETCEGFLFPDTYFLTVGMPIYIRQ